MAIDGRRNRWLREALAQPSGQQILDGYRELSKAIDSHRNRWLREALCTAARQAKKQFGPRVAAWPEFVRERRAPYSMKALKKVLPVPVKVAVAVLPLVNFPLSSVTD
jgi:hypothetical protein